VQACVMIWVCRVVTLGCRVIDCRRFETAHVPHLPRVEKCYTSSSLRVKVEAVRFFETSGISNCIAEA
jgi:hypothetical protein